MGAVGCLKQVKSAISVARSVMEHTEHTFLVGDDGRSILDSLASHANVLLIYRLCFFMQHLPLLWRWVL